MRATRLIRYVFFTLFLLALNACGSDMGDGAQLSDVCETRADCPNGQPCVEGYCVDDGGGLDAATDAANDTISDAELPPAKDGGGQADAADGLDQDECRDRLTCDDINADCGLHPDGCGGVIQCGGCGEGHICGTDDDDRGECIEASCTPLTDCSSAGYACGYMADGCGGTVACGTCDSDEYCGTGNDFGTCLELGGCTSALTCDDTGTQCGAMPDGCGEFVDCGACDPGQVCNGGICEQPSCIAKTCDELGASCGRMADGCGGLTEDCGTCSGGQVCGSGQQAGECVARSCTPKTCDDYNVNCGVMPDGCGGVTASCGTCASPAICGGSGIPNVCGAENTGPCQGEFCNDQVFCAAGQETTLTGTVFAPNGTLPIPNAVVYVPGVPLANLPPVSSGAVCEQCEDEDLGDPLVGTISEFDGSFSLENVPVGVDFPLVIKIGQWRRVVMVRVNDACTSVTLDSEQTRLAKTQGENSVHDTIPKIAIATGSIDAMECVFYKLGVDRSEFTRRSENGRIHLYRANGGVPDLGLYNACRSSSCNSGRCTSTNPSACNSLMRENMADKLFSNATLLESYDMVVSDCEASNRTRNNSQRDNLRNYVDAGGRFFASHLSHDWLKNNGSLQDPFTNTNPTKNNQTRVTGKVDTTHPRGQTFWSWLELVGAYLPPASNQQIEIHDPRGLVKSVDDSMAERWVYVPGTSTSRYNLQNTVQQFSFDTPVYPGSGAQCGRVAYSAFHVAVGAGGSSVSVGSGNQFPSYCSGGELMDQEKVLAYMLFDLASCVSDQGAPQPPVCEPLTDADVGNQCGIISDGCGGTLEGIECPDGMICGDENNPNQCVTPCTPLTCDEHGAECGNMPDGCGNTLDCGTCPSGEACGGGGEANICGCVPLSCDDHNAECGEVTDGCGQTLDCGTCDGDEICGAGGVPNQCGSDCTELTCDDHGAECGSLPDGCGGMIQCGDCDSPETCGGAGEPFICGCEPLTCDAHDAECGEVSDGCGGTLDCGGCEEGYLCEDRQCVEEACRVYLEPCERDDQCCSGACSRTLDGDKLCTLG